MDTRKFGVHCIRSFLVAACIGPVILDVVASTPADEDCSKMAVDECYKNLQTFLRLTTLPYSSSEQELDSFCDQATAGYNCSQTLYRSKCLQDKDRQLLPLFTSMGEYMLSMLCVGFKAGTGYLREAFLDHSQCIMENKEKVACCAEGTHIPDFPVMRILEESGKSLTARELLTCCPVSRYLECAETVVRESCGEAAANFTEEYIRRAAGQDVQLVCQKLPGYPQPETTSCPEPAPTCSGCDSIRQFTCITMLLTLVLATSRILRKVS